jgi:ankyrin repeat protein
MIAANAEVNVVDENGATALHYASDLWNVDLVKCLLEHGADPMLKDKAGVAPLHATLFQHQRITYQNIQNLLSGEARTNMGLGNQQQTNLVSALAVLDVYAKA